MGRKKKWTKAEREEYEEQYKIQLFEQPQGEQKRYVRATHYMLQHKAYISLSPSAKILLQYMKDCAFGCAGYWKSRKFEYSTTMLENMGVMSKSQTIRAMKELREKGFINGEYKHGKGAISRWSFSNRWYTGEKEPFPEEDKYESVKNTREWRNK